MVGEPLNDELIVGRHSYRSINQKVGALVLNQNSHSIPWAACFMVGFVLLQLMGLVVLWLLYRGIGIWGPNNPVMWGWDIINFVWWIGIGHAGTLISAILLLLKQSWRNSINRFAEAMTLFAVACAGLFPLLHTGRPYLAYWMFPYPNILAMSPNFRSPLLWDVFAISTYATVSAVFWFLGLIPDVASLRDRCKTPLFRGIFGLLALGWRGAASHWQRYESAYIILAGLSTPLVLSVHSIVSFDFAVSNLPGWHVTLFPPYFVAGAVYAGFAMVLTLAIPVRAWYNMKEFITMRHIDWMAKVMLATGLIVFYGYICEGFFSWYSGDIYEKAMMKYRMFGPYGLAYWLLILCNGVMPQFLWFPKIRQNLPALFIICQFVSVGMWLERFVIISVSLHRDFLPSSWGFYTPTIWDIGMFLGTIGQFTFLMFGFLRVLPMINTFEMQELWYRMTGRGHSHGHAHAGHGEPALAGHPAADGPEA